MRINPIPLIAGLLLTYYASAQNNDESYRLSLGSGSFIPQKNIATQSIGELNRKSALTGGRSFFVIQFESIPTEAEKQELQRAGIDLLEYIPNNAYTATGRGSLNLNLLSRTRTRAIVELSPEQKMQPTLVSGKYPAWIMKTSGALDVWISYPKTYSYEEVAGELKKRNIDIVSAGFKTYRIVAVRIAINRLTELAGLPFIEYVQGAPKEDEELNFNSEPNSRANVLTSALPGGRALSGDGVVIGVGDDANPLTNIDFAGRLINRAPLAAGVHGVHVIGTAAGGGIVHENLTGYAPKSNIVVQAFSGILANAPAYVQDHGMVVTNNSYGNIVGDCNYFGIYDLYSRVIDQQAFQMPNLQHVFACGNNGDYTCSPYLPAFRTVLGAYQTAKNSISVGNTNEVGYLYYQSGRGPVRDGRIKPEVCAQGTNIYSTYPNDAWGVRTGTSMASPAVTGGLALLYQRYRQLNGGANPKNALMKALICNGATDLGNAGPDFSYGFGWLNLLRSVKMLENNNYFIGSVNAGGSNTHTITIPAGSSIASLKVMLYWNDSAAAPFTNHALVNDLDLEVNAPVTGLHFPLVLDTLPGNVNNLAVENPDHINNIEQVVINNVVPGNYTFTVKGTTIPLSSQYDYVLVFDTIPVSTQLTYPIGDEHWFIGQPVYIRWDAYGNTTNDFTLQFSADNGATWSNIATGIGADVRQYLWTIPIINTGLARIKLIHNGTGIERISEPFAIMDRTAVSLSATQCEGYMAIDWTPVSGITDYEVMLLRGNEMVPIAQTTSTSYILGGLSKDSVYYMSVRLRVNGRPGIRAPAVSRQPNSGTCAGLISDKDLKIDTILSPISSGRKFTSRELSATTTITIRIKNLDDASTTGNIPVRYTVGANPPVNATIVSPNIAAGATYDYSFAVPVDMSAIGSYPLKVQVFYPGDPVLANDTMVKVYKQLDNPVINLASDFIDNLETAASQTYMNRQVGLEGLDRYDFVTSTVYGRLRTFVNTGIAYSGSKALSLDADRYNAAGTTDSLIATFNLQGYNVASDDIRFDFRYKQHGQAPNGANNVWVRGDDTKPWIPVYDLYLNQENTGIFKKTTSLELKNILAANSQNFSSSFQVRWGQWGQILMTDNDNAAGYTFDDIRLYKAIDDVQLISIDTPLVASCGLNSTVPVRITIRNSAIAAISNIPVFLKVDNNAPVMETITSIAGSTIVSYTFTATANLAANGPHTVRVWAALASDSYRDNDTAVVQLFNSPIISTYPYLQNFEASDGAWYTNGANSSWQYGTPVSTRIKGAASGTKAWKTGIPGNYNDRETSYLYSPCFNLTGMTTPTLSFSLALDLEDCGSSLCDAAWVEYSADGQTWTKLGAVGAGTNWYNKNYSGNHVWSIQNYTRWHVATIPLPTGMTRMRLRFVLQSDPYVSREGVAIDDIHIYDKQYAIYDGPPYTSSAVNQPAVNGSNWIHFTDGGKLVASINPNGQNLGSTDAQAYIFTGPVRNYGSQYYLNRNITIKPTTVNLPDSASVRFYFLDSESEALINATSCGFCTKPASAYELGVSKYSSNNDALENGDISDDSGPDWLFILPATAVKVPYDKGYYTEFKVKNFSEFWLNNGGFDNMQSLPLELTSFNVSKKLNEEVWVEWVTASEQNTDRFEVELANGNEEYRQNHFIRIGEVKSQGSSSTDQHYRFIDGEKPKYGTRYYRLKMIDKDGSFTYSAVRAVIFSDEVKWQTYPNPSNGIFNLIYQAEPGEEITIKVHDLNGKNVYQSHAIASGFVQKAVIDLSGTYASGLYLLEISAGTKKQTFSLIKK